MAILLSRSSEETQQGGHRKLVPVEAAPATQNAILQTLLLSSFPMRQYMLGVYTGVGLSKAEGWTACSEL